MQRPKGLTKNVRELGACEHFRPIVGRKQEGSGPLRKSPRRETLAKGGRQEVKIWKPVGWGSSLKDSIEKNGRVS